ncbi:MAG: DUF4381 domain-containing protein [Thiotrichales bacterium]
MSEPEIFTLRDIRGLDPASAWPPAPGWWLVLAGTVACLLLAHWGWRLWRDRQHQWRRDARLELIALRRQLRTGDPKQLASALSQLLRRIAMARCGRVACAGLAGAEWLAWLRANDPRGFDWQREGQILLTLPYAPRGSDSDRRALRRLLGALRPWATTNANPVKGLIHSPASAADAPRAPRVVS